MEKWWEQPFQTYFCGPVYSVPMNIRSKTSMCLSLIERFKANGALDPARDFKWMTPVGQGCVTTGDEISPGRPERSRRQAEVLFLQSREASQDQDSVTLGDGLTMIPSEQADRIWIHSEGETSGESQFHCLPVSRRKENRTPEMHQFIRLTETTADRLFIRVSNPKEIVVEESRVSLENPESNSFSTWILTR